MLISIVLLATVVGSLDDAADERSGLCTTLDIADDEWTRARCRSHLGATAAANRPGSLGSSLERHPSGIQPVVVERVTIPGPPPWVGEANTSQLGLEGSPHVHRAQGPFQVCVLGIDRWPCASDALLNPPGRLVIGMHAPPTLRYIDPHRPLRQPRNSAPAPYTRQSSSPTAVSCSARAAGIRHAKSKRQAGVMISRNANSRAPHVWSAAGIKTKVIFAVLHNGVLMNSSISTDFAAKLRLDGAPFSAPMSGVNLDQTRISVTLGLGETNSSAEDGFIAIDTWVERNGVYVEGSYTMRSVAVRSASWRAIEGGVNGTVLGAGVLGGHVRILASPLSDAQKPSLAHAHTRTHASVSVRCSVRSVLSVRASCRRVSDETTPALASRHSA